MKIPVRVNDQCIKPVIVLGTQFLPVPYDQTFLAVNEIVSVDCKDRLDFPADVIRPGRAFGRVWLGQFRSQLTCIRDLNPCAPTIGLIGTERLNTHRDRIIQISTLVREESILMRRIGCFFIIRDGCHIRGFQCHRCINRECIFRSSIRDRTGHQNEQGKKEHGDEHRLPDNFFHRLPPCVCFTAGTEMQKYYRKHSGACQFSLQAEKTGPCKEYGRRVLSLNTFSVSCLPL